MMRIAVIDRIRCQPKKCALECLKYCPLLRAGKEAIIMEGDKPKIVEELCAGCSICVNKCPFSAIKIIGLPDELRGQLIHQFGPNGFRLFGLPLPKKGEVLGILGENGIGKTTALKILAGEIIPNLGRYDGAVDWKYVIRSVESPQARQYFKCLADKKINVAVKPQSINAILADHGDKSVAEFLAENDQRCIADLVAKEFFLSEIKDRACSELSGGELQRLVIARTIVQEADIYFFDEPTSYLDVWQRLNLAKVLARLAEEKIVIVVEHDLAVLDFLADNIQIIYGVKGAYGVFTKNKSVNRAINEYLGGYLAQENVRIRDKPITFEKHPPHHGAARTPLINFGTLEKKFSRFHLRVQGGTIHVGEVVGVLGPNATGKTTFVKMLAGIEKPTKGKVDFAATVSYKPQYIRVDIDAEVGELLPSDDFLEVEVIKPLGLDKIRERRTTVLSGGEVQTLAVALCLSKKADIYLIDEPSANLDVNARILTAKVIRRFIEKSGKSALVVDHDIYFIDMVADRLMVFTGSPSLRGQAVGPLSMRDGMNKFLSELGITFRRDLESRRPRVNKPGSKLDREQKQIGEYYYA